MNKMNILLLASLIFSGSYTVLASDQESKDFDETQLPPEYRKQFGEMKDVLQLNIILMRLRSQISLHPEQDISSFFTSLTAVRWRKDFKKNGIEPIFMSDFFTGTLILNGPHDSSHAIAGMYNPWWDAILLLKAERKDIRNRWVFTSFEFLSGEDFRKEETKEIPEFDSVVARKGPQALAWMRLVEKTRHRFNEYFAANPMLFGGKFKDRFPDSSMKAILLRATLRMKLHQGMLEHKGVQKEMGDYLILLRGATPEQMKKVLKNTIDIQAFSLFNLLGTSFRKTMTYYGCWISEDARLYLYISKRNPRIAAMVCVLVGKSVSFEWYDLDDSEKFLKAFNERNKETEE